MNENIIAQKSIGFAIRIVNLYKFLCAEHKEYVLSKQILRSGTAVGAMIKEAEHAQSKLDFLHKMSIGLKEANETNYWLLLLKEGGYLQANEYESIKKNCEEILRLLASIVKTTKTSVKMKT
ncbi:four helix bundle protein [Parasegetibacter sp. MAH-26]|uniref:Four helix bundle protein n=2 Tax=Pinibacter aurantiacus TaxID=2851599 RepID=A0A9E2S6M0_9BACT|nr:four helix bundle protein [Pinibacter aurantiacus]